MQAILQPGGMTTQDNVYRTLSRSETPELFPPEIGA